MKGRKFIRKDLLNQDSKTKRGGGNKLVFNFTCHPAYSKLKNILSNINLLLTPNAQLRKVFPEVPIVGFMRRKSLKDLLVRAKVPVEKETDGKSCGCQGKRCEVCIFLEEKNTFTNKEGSDTYKIREGLHLDCNSENLIYLVTCKNAKNSMQEVVLLSFAHVLIITAVVTGSFVWAILSFKFHFMLILC